MATLKVKFRPSMISGHEGVIYYKVTHKSETKQIRTNYKLFPHEWDNERSAVIVPDNDVARASYLASLANRIDEDLSRFRYLIRHEGLAKSCSVHGIVCRYESSTRNGFTAYASQVVDDMVLIGRKRTAESYISAINSFKRFIGVREDIPLDSIDSNLMVRYETYLKSKDICPNSISYYMRNLRAIYNRAVDKELTLQRYPFKHVYTGIDKTVKRAVSLSVIRSIRDMDLSAVPSMDYARDIFMFSFYTRGMSFVDIAYLQKSDLRNGVLSYRRHKTNQQLFIKWEKPMQAIIDKHGMAGSPYLLPIIDANGIDPRRQYINASHLINRKLKKIGQSLGLSVTLTTYVARHAWASIARNNNIPISTISEAMGHDSERTTRIYLASLDTSVVDKANSRILKLL